MQDLLQPIIHKAPVMGIAVNVARTGLCIGDHAELRLLADGQVGIFAHSKQRHFGIFPRRALVQLGHLGPAALNLIAPAIMHGDHLRVRIVGLNPEHLSHSLAPEVHISVWGNPMRILAQAVAGATLKDPAQVAASEPLSDDAPALPAADQP